MSDTSNLRLPLLAAAQAQKHVTMNEALVRLDALAMPSVLDDAVIDPPEGGAEGDSFIVPLGANGAWQGHEAELAFRVGGGWDFATPRPGWRVWVRNRQREAVWTGAAWTGALLGPFSDGAHLFADLVAGDEVVPVGGAFETVVRIPDRAIVLGVTGRVMGTISGADVSSWRIGVVGSDNRYGSGIGMGAGASFNGVTGAPVAYYGATPLLISPEGGDFSGGTIRLAIHCLRLNAPDFSF